jgi:hypothetical protein
MDPQLRAAGLLAVELGQITDALTDLTAASRELLVATQGPRAD